MNHGGESILQRLTLQSVLRPMLGLKISNRLRTLINDKLKAELLQLTANYALQAGTINQSLSVPIYHPLSSPSRIRVLQPFRQFPVSLSISQSVDASNYLICFAVTSIFLSCKGFCDSILCLIHCITVLSTFADFTEGDSRAVSKQC